MVLNSIIPALNENIDSRYSKLIYNIYKNAVMVVHVYNSTNEIKIQRSVLRDNTMSPKVFMSDQVHTFKTIDRGDKRISINWEKPYHLSYAENIVLITNDLGEIRDILEELNIALKINPWRS